MIEAKIKELAEQVPDHALDALEADIWSGVAAHVQAQRVFKVVFASQTLVLAVALIGSAIAGHRWGTTRQPTDLGVFSPRATLAASTLLIGEKT